MKRITIITGSGYDKDNNRLSMGAIMIAKRDASKLLCEAFGGVTVSQVQGQWISDTNGLVGESGLKFEVMCEDDLALFNNSLKALAQTIRDLFNQEKVVLQVENLEVGEFI